MGYRFSQPSRAYRWAMMGMTFLALIALFLCFGAKLFRRVLPAEPPVAVTLTLLEKQAEATDNDARVQIFVNGYQIDPTTLMNTTDSQGWNARGEYLTSGDVGSTITLYFDSPQELRFQALSSKRGGRLSIATGNDAKVLDLYASVRDDSRAYQANLPLPYAKATYMGLVAIAVLFALSCLMLRRHIPLVGILGYAAAFVGLLALLYLRGMLTNLKLLTIVASGGMMAGIAFSSRLQKLVRDYLRFPYGLLTVVVYLYAVFACVGSQLFFAASVPTITIQTIAIFVLVALVCFPLLFAFFTVFDWLSARLTRKHIQTGRKAVTPAHVGWLVFGLQMLLLIVISLGQVPAVITPDSCYIWTKASGTDPLTNVWPALFVLFVRILSRIWNYPYIYTLVQMAAFSAVTSAFYSYFYIKGLKLWLVILLAVATVAAPNNFFTVLYMSTNPMFAIELLWLMYLSFRMMDDVKGFTHSWGWMLQWLLAMIATMFTRHNAFLAFYGVGFLFLVVTIKYFQQVKARLIVLFTVAFCCVQLIQGPLYSALGVKKTNDSANNSMKRVLTESIGCLLANGYNISDDNIATIDKILPAQNWASKDNAFDSDVFTNMEGGSPNYNNAKLPELMNIWLQVFREHPTIVTQRRLDACSMLWDVIEPQRGRFYNYHFSGHEFKYYIRPGSGDVLSDSQIKAQQTISATSAKLYVPEIDQVSIALGKCSFSTPYLDAFFWRAGFWIVAALMACVALVVRKKGRFALCILPCALSAVTLLLTIAWQIYAYYWFVPLCCGFFLLASLFTESEQTRNENLSEDSKE